MIRRWRNYWQTNRDDPIWWLCVIGVAISCFVLMALPSLVAASWLEAHQNCLPSKLHGYICK